jgi:hypothetical protein
MFMLLYSIETTQPGAEMSNTVRIPMPVLLERLRLQTQIRRLIQEHGETQAWHIVSQAIEREIPQKVKT